MSEKYNSKFNGTDVEKFNGQGYLIFKGFFNNNKIEQIKKDAIEIFSIQLSAKGYTLNSEADFEDALYKFFIDYKECFINCGKHIQHLISLHRLSLDELIVGRLKQLGLSFPNIATRPVLYFNSPKLATKEIFYKTPQHQDFPSMQSSLDSMVVWIPLIDVDKNLGAIEVVPGSHKYGNLATKMEDSFGLVEKYTDEDFTSVELEVGDVLFFSTFLVHRSGNISVNSIRWSCHFRYSNMNNKDFIERDFPHPYIYKSLAKI